MSRILYFLLLFFFYYTVLNIYLYRLLLRAIPYVISAVWDVYEDGSEKNKNLILKNNFKFHF